MNKIYYFTGTGNSLQIAQDLERKIDNCNIEKISSYKGEYIDGEVLCIVYPVYDWGMPLIVRKFFNQINVSESTMIYIVVNCAGLPGKSIDMADDILKEKNRKLSSGFVIKMPRNYIIGFDACSKEEQDKLFKNESKRVDYIAGCIKAKKEMPFEKSHFLIDRVFYNYFYKNVKNFHTDDSNFIVSDQCISCGLCAKICPVNNITMSNGTPKWNHNCELCLACIQSCPKEAINYGEKTKNRKRYLNPNVNL